MSFLNPVFLVGASLLIIPWLLHLLRQRDAPVQSFPSTRFLQHSESASSKSKKLSYKRLLSLRVLLLLAVCALFAQPVFKTVNNWMGAARQHHIVVIDQTFSMQADGRWSSAVASAESLLDSIPDAHPVQLVGWSGALVELHETINDRSASRQALASARAGYSHGDFGALMRRLDQYSADLVLPVSVYVISDMQASAMPARLNDLLAESIQSIQLISVSGDSSLNRWPSARVVSDSEEGFIVQATLNGDIPDDGTDITATLSTPERSIQSVSFKLQPGTGVWTADFDSLPWPSPGELAVYDVAAAADDLLPADDIRSLAVGADERVQILLTGNDLDSDSRSRRFLQTALLTDDRNIVTRDERLSGQSIGEFDVTVVHDPSVSALGVLALSPELQQYRAAGGHILAIASRAGDYLEDVGGVAASVGNIDTTHPTTIDTAGWRSVTLYRAAMNSLTSDVAVAEGFRVLVETGDGTPLLVEQLTPAQAQAGRLLWLTLPLDGDASDLPLSPVFVPWLHSVIDYMVRYNQYPGRLTVGDSLTLRGNSQLFDPEGEALLGVAESVAGATVNLQLPGVYQIQDRAGLQAVTVSTSVAESELRVASDALLTSWSEGINRSGVASDSMSEQDREDREQGSFVGVTQWLLLLCALLAVLEISYANRLLSVRRSGS